MYINGSGVRKTINFRFAISATISGYKARHNLSNGKILTPDDIEAVELELDKFASAPLEEFIPNSLVIKHFIREGSLLLSKQFELAKLIRKKDLIEINIEDGGLIISFKGEALDDGNIGDRIRVKSNDGKHFVATITSKNRVVVR